MDFGSRFLGNFFGYQSTYSHAGDTDYEKNEKPKIFFLEKCLILNTHSAYFFQKRKKQPDRPFAHLTTEREK